jgi:hypothetical protein
MADNCPFWSAGKCAPPAHDVHDCSWPSRDYNGCAVYKMVEVRQKGGSMLDALRASGAIPPGARVVGGGGSSSFGAYTYRPSPKKWWQFWK